MKLKDRVYTKYKELVPLRNHHAVYTFSLILCLPHLCLRDIQLIFNQYAQSKPASPAPAITILGAEELDERLSMYQERFLE